MAIIMYHMKFLVNNGVLVELVDEHNDKLWFVVCKNGQGKHPRTRIINEYSILV